MSAPAQPRKAQDDQGDRERKNALLTRSNAVAVERCGPPGGFTDDWLDRSVALAGSDEQFTAMTCRVESAGAVTGYLDYVVPQNATTFTAKVGIDRMSPNTSARVRFSVVDVDDNVVAQQAATYTSAPDITARVSGVPRIRLKMTVVKSGGVSSSNYFRSAWINPSFG
ncbi:NPCBM/NEW2 domain-containing protein [Microbispora sp. NPDC046973]|uniref:NPCBM/NEW2 domain-containing protein n=1 Tax=Microbispora sp. NPDC046973 TaxID=3155022 RepID=UPI0033C74D78